MASQVRVRDVMTDRVETLSSDERLSVIHLLRRFRGFRHLPVVRDARVVGILTRVDVLEHLAFGSEGATVTPEELMSQPAEVVGPDVPVEEAAARMYRIGGHALPVVGEAGSLVGILTETDLLAALAGERIPSAGLAEMTIDSLLSRHPTSVEPDATLASAAELMINRGIRHLPVLDAHDRPVGVVSESDLRVALGTDVSRWPDAPEGSLARQVFTVMSSPALTIKLGARLEAALRLFSEAKVGAAPVVDAVGRLRGMLSYVDLLEWMERQATSVRRPPPAPEPMTH